MISNINDNKKSYFIWLCVFCVLFIGLSGVMIYLTKTAEPDFFENNSFKYLLIFLFPYVIATLPIGWAVRRKYIKWYMHVPTEKIEVFETNLILALGRIFAVFFAVGVNFCLFDLFFVLSVIAGMLFTPYFIVSGIVFIVKKKI